MWYVLWKHKSEDIIQLCSLDEYIITDATKVYHNTFQKLFLYHDFLFIPYTQFVSCMHLNW